HIPLVFLMDCPGFLVGSAVEKAGIIRHGSKMLFAVAEATVPKITVVLRKGYGAGYYVMNGRAYETDLIVGWPTAEISVMGPEGAANSIFEPWRMVPSFSTFDPTRKPGQSIRKTSGMWKASQSHTNRAALSAALTSIAPPRNIGWFATIPKGRPPNRAKPVTKDRAQSGFIGKSSPSSTSDLMTR